MTKFVKLTKSSTGYSPQMPVWINVDAIQIVEQSNSKRRSIIELRTGPAIWVEGTLEEVFAEIMRAQA